MRSVDSLSGSVSDNKQFEEIIDLSSVSNKSAPVQLNTQENDTRGDKCEDLLNLNNLDGPPPTPIIAFEEKTAAQHDVPGWYSRHELAIVSCTQCPRLVLASRDNNYLMYSVSQVHTHVTR